MISVTASPLTPRLANSPTGEAQKRSVSQATAAAPAAASDVSIATLASRLAAAANDESGTFTINERRAAWEQAYKEEQAWREHVVAKAMQEYNQSGKLTNFFKDVLAHFQTLPALEQSQYPADYASDLTARITLDFNYFNHTAGDGPPTPGSLATLVRWS